MAASMSESKSVGTMTDAEFDALLPSEVQRASRIYWTPVAVARRAAHVFEELGVRRVLDVGSGPGKFCVVAAARAPSIAFVGIEHRPQLVTIAQALAAEVGITNATFSVGDTTRIPWTDFDACYVYNPFAENSFDAEDQFDSTVELSHARYVGEARRVADELAAAPVGRIVLTYHGLSGPIPSSYELVHIETAGTGWLRVWRKGTAGKADKYWVEEGPDVSCWVAAPVEGA